MADLVGRDFSLAYEVLAGNTARMSFYDIIVPRISMG